MTLASMVMEHTSAPHPGAAYSASGRKMLRIHCVLTVEQPDQTHTILPASRVVSVATHVTAECRRSNTGQRRMLHLLQQAKCRRLLACPRNFCGLLRQRISAALSAITVFPVRAYVVTTHYHRLGVPTTPGMGCGAFGIITMDPLLTDRDGEGCCKARITSSRIRSLCSNISRYSAMALMQS